MEGTRMDASGSAADGERSGDSGVDLGGAVRAGGGGGRSEREGGGLPSGARERGRGLGEPDGPRVVDAVALADRGAPALGPSALVVSVCRAAAVALVVYCGTLAVGLWWRISVAEARYAERLRSDADKRPPSRTELPTAPPIERSSGRVEYAYRREEHCGEEW